LLNREQFPESCTTNLTLVRKLHSERNPHWSPEEVEHELNSVPEPLIHFQSVVRLTRLKDHAQRAQADSIEPPAFVRPSASLRQGSVPDDRRFLLQAVYSLLRRQQILSTLLYLLISLCSRNRLLKYSRRPVQQQWAGNLGVMSMRDNILGRQPLCCMVRL
jgi:hypothetical protein